MHRTDEILERIYERDHDIGAFVIAAALENYSGFFNELDPSPFRKRDIDHDLRVFLEDCSSERALLNTLIEGAAWVAGSFFGKRFPCLRLGNEKSETRADTTNVSLQPKYGSATLMNLFRENAREMCITQFEPSNVVFPHS